MLYIRSKYVQYEYVLASDDAKDSRIQKVVTIRLLVRRKKERRKESEGINPKCLKLDNASTIIMIPMSQRIQARVLLLFIWMVATTHNNTPYSPVWAFQQRLLPLFRRNLHPTSSSMTGSVTTTNDQSNSQSGSPAIPSTTETRNNIFWPSRDEYVQQASEEERGDDDNDDNDDERKEQEESDDFPANCNIFDSIILIHCTHREPDCLMPWQNVQQESSTSSGFVINISGYKSTSSPNKNHKGDHGLRIMTNAHSVEYGSIVRVQKRGDSQKYLANIDTIGQECDLALLSVDDPEFWQEFVAPIASDDRGTTTTAASPLLFGSLPELQDEVEVLGYPTGGDSMSVTSGVVSRIEMQQYAQAGLHLLAMQIDAAINAGNSGGPVIDPYTGRVVGVAFQSLTEAENIGYVVPVPVVQHFLEDARRNHGRYTGFCSLGTRLNLLENESFRKSLGMIPTTTDDESNDSQHYSGVRIKSLSPLSRAHGILQPNDVILAIDGIPVANDGKIPFRPGERVSMVCYLQTKFDGDVVRLQLLRNNNDTNRGIVEADVPLAIFDDLVPSHWNSQAPPYLIAGGLVFTVLSCPYLEAAKAFDRYVSDELSYLVGLVNEPPSFEGEQVVVLNQVLAHRTNLGYDRLTDLHLTKVNGIKIRNLEHLQRVLALEDEHFEKKDNSNSNSNSNINQFLTFEFAPDERLIVLERSTMQEATQQVCEEHSIRTSYRL